MRAIQRFGKQLQQQRTIRGLTHDQLAVRLALRRERMPRIRPAPGERCLSHGIRTSLEGRCAVFSLFARRNSSLCE